MIVAVSSPPPRRKITSRGPSARARSSLRILTSTPSKAAVRRSTPLARASSLTRRRRSPRRRPARSAADPSGTARRPGRSPSSPNRASACGRSSALYWLAACSSQPAEFRTAGHSAALATERRWPTLATRWSRSVKAISRCSAGAAISRPASGADPLEPQPDRAVAARIRRAATEAGERRFNIAAPCVGVPGVPSLDEGEPCVPWPPGNVIPLTAGRSCATAGREQRESAHNPGVYRRIFITP